MVRVTEDREQKLVDVIITGFATTDEVAAHPTRSRRP